jgi:hypothetical protein
VSEVLTPSAAPARRESDWQRRFTGGQFFGLLESTSQLKMFLETSAAACLGFAAVLGLAVLVVYTDAVLALPSTGLVAVDFLLAAALVAASVFAIRRIVHNRFDARRTARLLEDRLDVQNSVFINAVEFASAPPRGDSPLLRERAIRMAEERAAPLSSFDVLSFRPLYRALGIAAGAAAAALVLWFMTPRVFGMVVPRLLDPTGDHPPYTLVEFNVQISPEPVYHGKAATISATLGGPEQVEQASVVFIDSDPDASSVGVAHPMYHAGERQFALHIDRAETTRQFYIDTPRGRSETMTLTVVEVPFFEEIRIAYEYPAYTGWSGHEHRLDGRGLRALVGTLLTLTVRSNLPLQGGQLVLTPKAEEGQPSPGAPVTVTLSPSPDDSKVVAGTFPIEFSGRFELTIAARSGAVSLDHPDGPVTAIADRFPTVSIVSPGPYVAVVENWKVPVVIEALDDVGIAQLRLYRSVNGWGPNAVELEFERPQPYSARAQTEFDLPALGAHAGDIITYYVSAYDNHPGGTQFRDTETHVIQVISEEEYQQFARQQYQMDEMIEELQAFREDLDRLEQQRHELLEQLEELKKQMEASSQSTEEMQQKMQELQEQLQKYSESAEQLSKELQERAEQLQLYEMEEPYLEMLRKTSEQLQQQSDNSQHAAEALDKLQQQPLNAQHQSDFQQAEQLFREQNEPFSQEQKEQLDAAAEDMELYKMADSLLASADRMRSIIQRQRQLADRMAEFRDQQNLTPQDQARADRLAKDQELLEQDLQEAVKQMRESAEKAQERLPQMCQSAQQLCDKIGELGISQDQRNAAQQARTGKGSESHEAAESAAQKLESLQSECSNCEGAAGEMCNGLDGPLSLSKDRLQQALNQLAQGRGIPGLSRGQGQGQGEGQPGQGQVRGQQREGGFGTSGEGGLDGNGQANMPYWRPGQTFPGSQAPINILGPHTLEQMMEREQRDGRMQGDGRGQWVPLGGVDDPLAAERINSGTRESSHSAAGNLRGVPVPYRDAAEAYFRRMAEGK